MDNSNNIVVADIAIADVFNNHFASVDVIDNGVFPADIPVNCTEVLDFVIFTKSNVLSAIKKLKPNLSA